MPVILAALAAILFWLSIAAGYITHWVWAIKLLAGDAVVPTAKIVLAVLGILPPVGVIHGWLIWFGAGG